MPCHLIASVFPNVRHTLSTTAVFKFLLHSSPACHMFATKITDKNWKLNLIVIEQTFISHRCYCTLLNLISTTVSNAAIAMHSTLDIFPNFTMYHSLRVQYKLTGLLAINNVSIALWNILADIWYRKIWWSAPLHQLPLQCNSVVENANDVVLWYTNPANLVIEDQQQLTMLTKIPVSCIQRSATLNIYISNAATLCQ